VESCVLDASLSEQEPVSFSCERGSKPSGSIKGGKFLDKLNDS
jgi:hypothetical protein